jgi:hypothetical protein
MLNTKELVKQFIKDTVPYNNLKPTDASFTIPANSSYVFNIDEKPQYNNFFVQFVLGVSSANLTISDGANSETAQYIESAGIYVSSSTASITITNNEAFDVQITNVAYFNIDSMNLDANFIGGYLFGYQTGVSIKDWVYQQSSFSGIDGFVFQPNQFFAYILTFKPFSKFNGSFCLNCTTFTGFDVLDSAYDANNQYIIVPAFDISNIDISQFSVLSQNNKNITAQIVDKRSTYGTYSNVLLIKTYKDGVDHTLSSAYKFYLVHK